MDQTGALIAQAMEKVFISYSLFGEFYFAISASKVGLGRFSNGYRGYMDETLGKDNFGCLAKSNAFWGALRLFKWTKVSDVYGMGSTKIVPPTHICT